MDDEMIYEETTEEIVEAVPEEIAEDPTPEIQGVYSGESIPRVNSYEYIQKQLEKERKPHPGLQKFFRAICCALIMGGAVIIGAHAASTDLASAIRSGDFRFPEIKISERKDGKTESGSYASLADLIDDCSHSFAFILNPVSDMEEIGSAVVIGEQGDYLYLVTCFHLVENQKLIEVRFTDGKNNQSVVAYLRGYDRDSDLAVLSITKSQLNKDVLSYIKLPVFGSTETLKQGDLAVIIGASEDDDTLPAATVGALSYINRSVSYVDAENVSTTYTLLQTDASMNPGNSGCGLYNGKGELIGICNIDFTDYSAENIAFAYPIDKAMNILEALITYGKYTRPFLGITGSDVTNWTLAESLGLTEGVVIISVVDGGAAKRSGLEAYDVITYFNDTKIETMTQLQGIIASANLHDEYTVTYLRYNEETGELSEHKVILKLFDKEDTTLNNN